MKFQVFRLIWMLFIQRIRTKPSFSIIPDTPEINICSGRQNSKSWPKWTTIIRLDTTETELKKYQDPIEIYIKPNRKNSIYEKLCEIKIGDISKGKCPPPKIPWDFDISCYCGRSGPGWFHLYVTRISYFYENEALLWIKFPFGEYKDTLPVTILAQTCFSFQQPHYGVTTTWTIQTGDFWYAIGYLEIALADKSSYGSEVKVEKENDLLLCTIELTHCPPKELSTGDIICYCEGKNQHAEFIKYRLKVRAKAQTSQSKTDIFAELESTSGGASLFDYIGTLPTIEEKPTTTTTITRNSEIKSQGTTLSTTLSTTLEQSTILENTTKAISSNIWLILQILLVPVSCVISLYLIKLCRTRKRNLSLETSNREQEKSKREQEKSKSEQEKSKREQEKSKRKHETSKREPTNCETEYLPTKDGSHSSDTRKMEGTSVDLTSYGNHSKMDSNSYTFSHVSNFNV